MGIQEWKIHHFSQTSQFICFEVKLPTISNDFSDLRESFPNTLTLQFSKYLYFQVILTPVSSNYEMEKKILIEINMATQEGKPERFSQFLKILSLKW